MAFYNHGDAAAPANAHIPENVDVTIIIEGVQGDQHCRPYSYCQVFAAIFLVPRPLDLYIQGWSVIASNLPRELINGRMRDFMAPGTVLSLKNRYWGEGPLCRTQGADRSCISFTS